MGLDRRRLLQRTAALAAVGGFEPAAASAASGARKVLRVAFPAAETSFDPPQTNSDLYSATVIAQILEAPLGYDYLARPPRLLPVTAQSLPEVSDDGRTFTLRIRPGIYFADDAAFKGKRRELVAQDYVYAIKRYYDPQYNSGDLYSFEMVKPPGLAELRDKALKNRTPFEYDTEVEGVRALDRYTLRIHLGVPDPRFVYRLADPSGMGAVAREVVEHYGKEIGAHPVGTGAFRLKSWTRGSRIELERSPHWRGTVYEGRPADEPLAQEIAGALQGRALPLVDEVRIDILEEDQPRWLSFLNGDFAWLAVPGPYVALAAPGGRLAPFLQKKGCGCSARPRPTWA
jgi:ABC-type transport system substrate-binding protein